LAPTTLDRLALSYEALAFDNRRLVVTAITSFGLEGPNRDWEATELIAQAANGMMHLTGDPEREPLRFSQAQTQLVAGVNAAVSTLIAVAGARRDGEGQLIDVNTLESVASTYHQFLTNYTFQGVVSRRGVADVFPCRDSYLVATPGAARNWSDYAAFLGAPELDEPAFATPSARARNRPALRAIMAERLAARAPVEWFHAAQAERLPWGMMQAIDAILACPQLAAREFFETVEHPRAGHFAMPGPPLKLPASPWAIRRPAPRLGEHTAEVLGEIGYGRGEVARLYRSGVV
jgi:crotonobetainyl-CoA:carnitine CoA-transferase CaiB-like acyl-CoA transferase